MSICLNISSHKQNILVLGYCGSSHAPEKLTCYQTFLDKNHIEIYVVYHSHSQYPEHWNHAANVISDDACNQFELITHLINS